MRQRKNHPGIVREKTKLLWFLLVFLCLLAWAFSAQAGITPDYVRHLKAVGFDRGGDLYALKIDVTSGVPSIAVREIDTGARVADISTPTRHKEERALKSLSDRYGIDQRNAHEGPVSPDGRYTLMGAPNRNGKEYRILVMEGTRVGELHRFPLKKHEKTKTRATGMLKQVLWSKDGSRLLAIINEKYRGESESYEVDRPLSLRFKKWKIRWYRPQKPKEKKEK